MLTPQQKADWVAALRSGKYQQITGALCRVSSNGECKYCCLGVLQDLNGGWREESVPLGFASNLLKITAGIGSALICDLTLGQLVTSDSGAVGKLMDMNDNQGKTFAEIADFIEKEIPCAPTEP